MHNLRDYLFVLTSVKTYLSLLFKKHPKKGAFMYILELLKSYRRRSC